VVIFRIKYSLFYPEDGAISQTRAHFIINAVKTSDVTKTMPICADKAGDV
jgi:hypothetical protein